ncbi:AFR137Cp [Eremothecium gossypii ATCC 10895]|uniref:Isocitrate dehydrogenase [NAD] subunit 2, mitochondrial n=1 Tax=Eremothecium gossypii (strain ATCC 10895 / CBS 109.51 / FGSC 9923 / NRRL Y-1056) TaxID=284811 RepID=Q754D3_EREGS|nr:AFR137Cp [Eremothecium gossypii ATCC 10895]AAS53508.1 AFR137Cp [Eremothecium gossypii ATCC 10895]AEY97820.1 FAFR137Cp [Eremothecium gossypii FDAG1]
MLRQKLFQGSRRWLASVRQPSIGRYAGKPNAAGKYTVSFIEGDGVGPEISQSVKDIFSAASVPVEWEYCDVTPLLVNGLTTIPEPAVASINKNLVALKGPLATPIGKGHRSLNLTLRKTFGLFANVRPAKSIEGYKTTYSDVDLVLIRENTEGEYSGIEHVVSPGVVQSIKLITREASERVIRYAFEYARTVGRPKVVVVHKSTIQRLADGLFVNVAQELGREYPDIELQTELLDNTVLNVVTKPEAYKDVVAVCPNLYGDILSDLNSGLSAGSLGLTPSANIGHQVSIFEAVHGSAPDIAGQNRANPTALLLSSVMMLNHMGLHEHAGRIEKAVLSTIASSRENRTADLAGTASTSSFTNAVIERL